MGENVVIINGATREDGNTDRILDEIQGGASDTGIEILVYNLRELEISDCIGCCQCLQESKCHFQDDMNLIRRSVEISDLIIFASPIYWCDVTGIMKTFIDRLYFYHHEVNAHLISGKRALVIATLGETNIFWETEVLISFFNRLFFSLKIDLVDMEFFGGLMEKDAIQNKSEYLVRAYGLGLKIPELF